MTKKKALELLADLVNCDYKDQIKMSNARKRAIDFLSENKWINAGGKWTEGAKRKRGRNKVKSEIPKPAISIVKKKCLFLEGFNEIPWSLNHLMRANVGDRVREKRRWESLIMNAWLQCDIPEPPVKGDLRVLVFRVYSAKPMDRSNAIGGFNKLITDNLLSKYVRKVKGLGMMEVPGKIPLIYDDDMKHVHEEYVWESNVGYEGPVFFIEIWST